MPDLPLWFWLLAGVGLTLIVTVSAIAWPLRLWGKHIWDRLIKRFYCPLYCPMCFGFWAGLLFGLIRSHSLPVLPWIGQGLMLGFATSATSLFAHVWLLSNGVQATPQDDARRADPEGEP